MQRAVKGGRRGELKKNVLGLFPLSSHIVSGLFEIEALLVFFQSNNLRWNNLDASLSPYQYCVVNRSFVFLINLNFIAHDLLKDSICF